jgi:hypothetical protein
MEERFRTMLASRFWLIWRAIPLRYELLGFIDWAFTDTTLFISEWFMFQDMYSQLYVSACVYQAVMEINRVKGDRQPGWKKWVFGVVPAAGILIALVLPLLLYSNLTSTLNLGTSGQVYREVKYIDMELAIPGYSTMYRTKATATVSKAGSTYLTATDARVLSTSTFSYLNSGSTIPEAQQGAWKSRMAEFSASKYSDQMWESSTEVIQKLATGLNDYTVKDLQIQYTFTSGEQGVGAKTNSYDTRTLIQSLQMSNVQTQSLALIVRNCSAGVYDAGTLSVAGSLFPRTLWLEHEVAAAASTTSTSGEAVQIKQNILDSENILVDGTTNPAFDVCNLTCHGIPLFEPITIDVMRTNATHTYADGSSVTVPASTKWPESTGEMRWDMWCASSQEVRSTNRCCAIATASLCPPRAARAAAALAAPLAHTACIRAILYCSYCSPLRATLRQQGPKLYVATESQFVATQWLTTLFGATGVVGLYTLLIVVLARSIRNACTNKEKEVPYTTWYQTGYLLTICENIMAARALEAVNPAKKPFLLFSPDAVARTFDLCTCSQCVFVVVDEVASLSLSLSLSLSDTQTQTHTHTPHTHTHTAPRFSAPSSTNRNAMCDWLERGCTKEVPRDSESDDDVRNPLDDDGTIDDSRDDIAFSGGLSSATSAQSGGSESTSALVLHIDEESAEEESNGAYSEWLAIEEKLFRHLVDVYRQPAELYRLTGRYEHWWDEKDDATRQR